MHTQNPDQPNWYCYTTPARREAAAAVALSGVAENVLAPRILTTRVRCLKVDRIPAPLFPGYGFALAPLSSLQDAIKQTWDIRALVGFGDGPVIVPDEVIDEILCRIDKSGFVKLTALAPGDEVEVIAGPFEGLRGIFQRADSAARVVLLMAFMSNFNVTLPSGVVRKLS
ncbi:MAG: hypothetical protein L0229_22495 [Blastocatellia bacterium]|nr:hypothetical protein [Blastocatellia bacterium]